MDYNEKNGFLYFYFVYICILFLLINRDVLFKQTVKKYVKSEETFKQQEERKRMRWRETRTTCTRKISATP